MSGSNVFSYFAYGSNLLLERIQISNPTAKSPRVAKLKGYCFSFEATEQRDAMEDVIMGACATVTKGGPDDYVYGLVWSIDADQLKHLDRQESGYEATNVEVELVNGGKEICRTYQMAGDFNGNQKPYPYYKKIVVAGAKQNGLPADYIRFLESFEALGNIEVPSHLQKVMQAVGTDKL